MVHCCVLGCGNRSERKSENVTFHTFPKDEDTRSRWITFTGRKNWKPSKYDRMCSKHFESYCFYKTKYKVYLKNFALPTQSKHLVAKTRNRSSASKNNEVSVWQPQLPTSQGPSYQTSSTNHCISKKLSMNPPQVSGYPGTVEIDVQISSVEEEAGIEEEDNGDEEDYAIKAVEDEDKEYSEENEMEPMCMPVHTTLTVKDEVYRPGKSSPDDIDRVNVECDDGDKELNNGRDAVRSGAVGESRRGERVFNKSRQGMGRNVKPGKPLVEKFISDEDLPEISKELDKNEMKEENVDSNVEEEELDEFQWRPLNGWHVLKRPFIQKYSGPTAVFTSPYATFRSIWDNSILSYIATETNRYAYTQSITDEINDWVETNVDEILILFAFWIMLGIIKMPNIKACFIHEVPILRTDVFRRLLSENRYMKLMRSFYVIDESRDPNDPEDFLFHFRTLIDHLNNKFKDQCTLEQDVCIDESSNLWKTANCPLGIKIHHVCESSTGYIWSFLVDSKRKMATSSLPDVVYVMKLMHPLLHLGHTLYTDSWFSTPVLARYLKQKHTNFVGVIRTWQDLPPIIKNAALNEGEFVARHSGDVMAVAVNNGKRQNFLSTCHGVNQIQDCDSELTGQYKLVLVDEYERGMRKIDPMDFCIEPYMEQNVQWPIKLFKILLNMTINNAHILLEKSTNMKFDSLGIRLSLVKTIIDRHQNKVPRFDSMANLPSGRLRGRHFIKRISISGEEMGTKVNDMYQIRKSCVWCTQNGRNNRTGFECPDCNVALCLDVCFEEFHTISG